MKNICILSPDVGVRKKISDELKSIYGQGLTVHQFEKVRSLKGHIKDLQIDLIISSFFDAEMSAIINSSAELQQIQPGLKIIIFHDRSDARFNTKCAQHKRYGVHEECLEKRNCPAIIQVAVDNLSAPEKTSNKRPPSP